MPIKGLTDRAPGPTHSGGKLRLGKKVKKKNRQGKTVEVPEKVDHFIFDPEKRELVAVFEGLFGSGPKELPVFLPSGECFS